MLLQLVLCQLLASFKSATQWLGLCWVKCFWPHEILDGLCSAKYGAIDTVPFECKGLGWVLYVGIQSLPSILPHWVTKSSQVWLVQWLEWAVSSERKYIWNNELINALHHAADCPCCQWKLRGSQPTHKKPILVWTFFLMPQIITCTQDLPGSHRINNSTIYDVHINYQVVANYQLHTKPLLWQLTPPSFYPLSQKTPYIKHTCQPQSRRDLFPFYRDFWPT